MTLQTPLKQHTNHVFKIFADKLEKLRINTIEDFLYHLPARYEDYSVISKINQVQAGETVTIQGQIIEIKNQYLKNARIRTIQKAIVCDDTGTIELIWFNQPFLIKSINKNSKISASGRVEGSGKKISMQSPEFEILINGQPPIHTGRLIPVYPETKGISSKWLRRQIHKILKDHKNELLEYLPTNIIDKFQFMDFSQALKEIHFPRDLNFAQKAKERLAFDELFLIQLSALKRKKEWKQNITAQPFTIKKYQKELNNFVDSLPFTLTNTQQKAIKEITQDLEQNKSMNRLLQGDVGSGKTVVAAVAMYTAFLNGFQSILLAPTEILAQQHYDTISKLLSPFGIKVDLVTGSKKQSVIPAEWLQAMSPPARQGQSEVKRSRGISCHKSTNSKFDILVGTHALLSDKIKLDKLALVIIDEQQRFGVEQRGIIRKKGTNPHLLTMTATPIPRTVALTMYGDLDLSYLNEIPIGRKKIKTWLVPAEKRNAAYDWIRDQIKKTDSQTFIICPFIEQSESMQTVKAASKEYDRLKKQIFPNIKICLLHGKLKSKEKEQVMSDFKNKKLDILVATPIVEVGIDIPNATIIIIETAERFGLAQLHQLRGRVGRGDKQSYCLLFSESQTESVTKRLKSLETIYSGAELAELDLRLRGPGNLYGTAQHGIPKLKVASFSDTLLIQKARFEAQEVFPNITSYPLLEKKVNAITLQTITPD